MSATVADFLVTRLSEWGVKRLFGYPADGTALARDKFKFSAGPPRHHSRNGSPD